MFTMKKTLISLCLYFLLVCSAVAQANNLGSHFADDLKCSKCNVIFLDIDLLRADFVGAVNGTKKIAPNINDFFGESIRFGDVSSASGVTAISNTATLTGRDGFFTYSLLKNTYVDTPPQMPHKFGRLYSGTPTIAEILKKNGYRTVNVNHGYYAGKQMLLNRGFDTYWGTGEVDSPTNIPGHAIQKTAEFIKELSKSNDPYFILLRSEDLRGLPYRYPANRGKYEDPRIEYRKIDNTHFDIIYQLRSDGKPTVDFPHYPRADWLSKSQLSEYEQLSKKLYAQQLKYVDEELGNLFEILKNSKTLDRTLVILYSNHGDGLYDNRIPNHGVSYQSCISVPLMIRHPKVHSPVLIDSAVALIDLVPTVYQMLGIPSQNASEGIGLVDFIGARSPFPQRLFFGVDRESQYVRRGNMKLIAWADRSLELYDLANDPGEKNNLKELQPNLAAELDEILSEHEMSSLDQALKLLLSDKRLGTWRGNSD